MPEAQRYDIYQHGSPDERAITADCSPALRESPAFNLC